MPVLRNIGVLATCRNEGAQSEIHEIRRAALAWSDGKITWVGEEQKLPKNLENGERFDADGRLVIPGLIDCHTHLVFSGWRADEFVARNAGKSYLDIARGGGGIIRTVKATREATEDDLFARADSFLEEMESLGVTCVEGKSGYGLNEQDELKILRVYRRLEATRRGRVIPTFLGAHTIPPEHQHDPESYVNFLCEKLIPRVASEGLAHFCDMFIENGAFSPGHALRIFSAAERAGLYSTAHIDQFSDQSSSLFEGRPKLISASHLEHTGDAAIGRFADAGIVAVILPFATLFTHESPVAARRFIDRGVQIAVATDFNPGSAPSFHLPFALSLACIESRLTPGEALKGGTIVAARALRLDRETGSLEAGKAADFAVLDAESVEQWLYHLRSNCCVAAVRGGSVIHGQLPRLG